MEFSGLEQECILADYFRFITNDKTESKNTLILDLYNSNYYILNIVKDIYINVKLNLVLNNFSTIINSKKGKKAYRIINIFTNTVYGYYLPEKNILISFIPLLNNNEIVSLDRYILANYLVKKLGLKKVEKKIEITVGCDPEYEIFTKTRPYCVIDASDLFGDKILDDEIGTDGWGNQLELRPIPGSPAYVVRRLKKLISDFYKNHNTKLSVKGDIYPLGGHIHIGFRKNGSFARRGFEKLVPILDDFIGRFTIELSGEARGDYKALGKYRIQPHGLEYRTPPSIIFQNPKIAEIVLKLAYNLANKYVNSEVIEYSVPVTRKDLMEVGGLTEKETDLYIENINKLRKLSRNKNVFIAGWYRHKKRFVDLVIKFSDEWDSDIENEVQKYFSNYLVLDNLNIIFFGFNESRGLVSNIPNIQNSGIWNYINGFPIIIADNIKIGFPYLFRTDLEYYLKTYNCVFEILKKELEKFKIKRKEESKCV